MDIESLDDLFDDIDDKKESKPNKTEPKKEETMSDILDDFDAPVLPQEDDEDTYDLQKELEAKFDELFGPLDEE